MAQRTLIFAYGTLMRGECRHWLLQDQQFVGEAHTAPQYRLYHCGTFPALVADGQQGNSIVGEVWSVEGSRLQALDDEEGIADQLYQRARINLAAPFANQVVEGYLYLGSTASLPDCGVSWRARD